MASVYFHIPYCRQKCHYCDFHFSVNLKDAEVMIGALQKELHIQRNFFSSSDIVESIYFGGGTPSLLSVEKLETLIESVKSKFLVSNDAEVTVETNPDDLSKEYLNNLSSIGVNRLSIGVQSFYDEDLKYFNRVHNSERAISCIKEAQDAGFENITIDLIYGVPNMSNDRWISNINQAVELMVPHVSCYSLTVEERTALHKMVAAKKSPPLDDELSALHFETLIEMLKEKGYVHYEISNFGKPGYFSRHNINYWKYGKYLGIGPSAHSFDGENRQWNISNNSKYIKTLNEDTIPFEKEILSREQKFNEYVLTSLRTMWGIDLNFIIENFGQEMLCHLRRETNKFLELHWVEETQSHLVLTDKGKQFADHISSTLFIVK